MKKIICTLIVAILTVYAMSSPVMANSDLSIELISPSGANARPIYEDTVVSKITNNTNETMNNLLVYITIIDTKNNIAVAVDEYGSTVDKPRKIDTLAPGETVTIEIPIRFMYVGEYELYTSVMHKGSDTVISSSPITLVMIGDSNINTNLVMAVSIVIPVILLVIIAWLYMNQRKRRNVK